MRFFNNRILYTLVILFASVMTACQNFRAVNLQVTLATGLYTPNTIGRDGCVEIVA